MYDEQVKRLKERAGAFDYDGRPDIACDYEQAAYVIEKLTAIREEQKAQIIAMAAEIEEQLPRWIPVTERLPDAGERVLCYCRANIYEVMKMRTDGDWVYGTNHIYMHSFVTHWMPLPQPPKEEAT